MFAPVLLLVGLPESGTSALADALLRAGAVAPPPELGDPATVSQHALAACGMRWDSLAVFPTKLGSAPALDAARAAIDSFLKRAPADQPLLVAEPLATRIAGLWRERLEASERPFSTVLWVAHPGKTTAALARQRRFAPEKSLALWLAHLIEYELSTRGSPRTVVAEDAFLADPGGSLKRIGQATRFPPAIAAAKAPPATAPVAPPPPLGLGSGLDAALDQGYRKLSSNASGELKRAMDALAAAARPALQSAVSPWLAQEIEADRARLQALADTAASQAARAERATKEAGAAPREVKSLAAQIEALRAEQAREREALRAEQAHEREQLSGELAALRATSSKEREAFSAQLDQARAAAAKERETLAAQLEKSHADLARLGTALADAPQAESTLRAEIVQTQRELMDERATIMKLSDALEAARREADGHSHRFESARHHLERFANEIDELRNTLATREDLYARVSSEADALHVRVAQLEQDRGNLERERDAAVLARDELTRFAAAREATIVRDLEERRNTIEERDRQIAALSAENDREADAIAEAAIRVATLEEEAESRMVELEQKNNEIAELRKRMDELTARLKSLESNSLVRAARWLGGESQPEGRS
jgi:hypothetical protein